MIAKIIKGISFRGMINYLLEKEKGKARILLAEGVRAKSPNQIAEGFELQASMSSRIKKPVGHFILGFSPQDRFMLDDERMTEIAEDYLQAMGCKDTQYLIVRHLDREHPHLHICYNRVGNNGKAISDSNERYRSTKVCKDLSKKYGLTLGNGKAKVNRHRLRGNDKLRYEIYDAIKEVLPKTQSWQDFQNVLLEQGIKTHFKTKGNTDEIQGVVFEKEGMRFNGSKVDRAFSFSKLNAQIMQQANEVKVQKVQEEFQQTEGYSDSLIDDLLAPNDISDEIAEKWQKKLRAEANNRNRIKRIRR